MRENELGRGREEVGDRGSEAVSVLTAESHSMAGTQELSPSQMLNRLSHAGAPSLFKFKERERQRDRA